MTCQTCSKPLVGRGKCKSYAHKAIGPQKVGGVYRNDKWSEAYTVLAINFGDDQTGWSIDCQDIEGNYRQVRRHCTPWNDRKGVLGGVVVSQSLAEVA